MYSVANSFISKIKNFDWNNFLTNSSELECNQINDTKAKFEELKNEFSDIFKENLQSKVKGKLAHLVLKKYAVPKFLLLAPFQLLLKSKSMQK